MLVAAAILFCFAEACAFEPFPAQVNADDINLRSDSTVGSEAICSLRKGDIVEVVMESYDWYKVRLPLCAPSFIKSSFVSVIDEKSGKVSGSRVNVRLRPDESSPILGRADKDEVINILGEKGNWYRIAPINNSFGWAHKKFLSRVEAPLKEAVQAPVKKEPVVKKNKEIVTASAQAKEEDIVIEGVVVPYGKVFGRKATHKLDAGDKGIFLLKGNTQNLNSLTNHKVKISGKLTADPKQRIAIIEVQKMEALD